MRRWLVLSIAIVLMVAMLVAVGSTFWLRSFGAAPSGARLERIRRSSQFGDGKFRNPVPTNMLAPGSFFAMLRHQFFGDEERVTKRTLPVVTHDASDYATAAASGLRATWIGHASALVEIDGRRVLTDPIWSARCSPVSWLGPKRFHAPPVPLEALPAIDAVVISHDHFDHLDMATVQALAARGAHFAVPLGVGAHLEAWGIQPAQISELDWNESVDVAGLRLTATPARHYSGRNPLRKDNTLWASWVVQGPRHNFFFSGDTGYFDGFKTIGKSYGPFDLALIKIGACDVTWPDIHITPEEAVQVFLDVRGKLLLPVHWGTFNLAFHAWNDPAERVLAAAQTAGAHLVVPRPGEFVTPSLTENSGPPPAVDAWWR
jgi:L-ascorbate metabolism protein UlaG (beta-lactamase superfamily)